MTIRPRDPVFEPLPGDKLNKMSGKVKVTREMVRRDGLYIIVLITYSDGRDQIEDRTAFDSWTRLAIAADSIEAVRT